MVTKLAEKVIMWSLSGLMLASTALSHTGCRMQDEATQRIKQDHVIEQTIGSKPAQSQKQFGIEALFLMKNTMIIIFL